MNLPKPIVLSFLLAGCLSGCFYNDYYGQAGQYGNPGYGDNAAYGQVAPGVGGQAAGAYPDPAGGVYGTDQGSESGNVVSIPGDGGSAYNPGTGAAGNNYGAPMYGGGTTPTGRTYTVKKGDNLYRIGKANGVTMQAIIEQNGLQSTTIHPGQQLIIP